MSLWGKTLNLHGLYPRKIVNLSESDERGISAAEYIVELGGCKVDHLWGADQAILMGAGCCREVAHLSKGESLWFKSFRRVDQCR